nr:subclass B1 metallo-beta-lactamase [uncultured Pedobacter sp.]
MSFKRYPVIVFLLLGSRCFAQKQLVNIVQIAPKVYIHESFLQTKDFGKVSCNGLIFINNNQALVFDTPANEEATVELINCIQDSLNAKIVGVVVNHFHDDCLAGLALFHQLNIPSYANYRTIELAKLKGRQIPENGFNKKLILKVGGERVGNFYFGAAHTKDNIVSYIPGEKVLFGGCMTKALGANKGNLEDADTLQWAKTIRKVEKLKPVIVVPGHGKVGGADLLLYTENLFKREVGN